MSKLRSVQQAIIFGNPRLGLSEQLTSRAYSLVDGSIKPRNFNSRIVACNRRLQLHLEHQETTRLASREVRGIREGSQGTQLLVDEGQSMLMPANGRHVDCQTDHERWVPTVSEPPEGTLGATSSIVGLVDEGKYVFTSLLARYLASSSEPPGIHLVAFGEAQPRVE